MTKLWKGRRVLTVEDMAKMDCPFPPEPKWEEEFNKGETMQKSNGTIIKFNGKNMEDINCCGQPMDYWTGQFIWLCLKCGMACSSMSKTKAIFEYSPLYDTIAELKAELAAAGVKITKKTPERVQDESDRIFSGCNCENPGQCDGCPDEEDDNASSKT